MTRLPRKKIGRWAADRLARRTGKSVDFIEFDGERFHFCITRYSLCKVIGLDGRTEREATIIDNRHAPSALPVYTVMACYPAQLLDGDAVMFVDNQLTQNKRLEN